jgi:hypothetical protein
MIISSWLGICSPGSCFTTHVSVPWRRTLDVCGCIPASSQLQWHRNEAATATLTEVDSGHDCATLAQLMQSEVRARGREGGREGGLEGVAGALHESPIHCVFEQVAFMLVQSHPGIFFVVGNGKVRGSDEHAAESATGQNPTVLDAESLE